MIRGRVAGTKMQLDKLGSTAHPAQHKPYSVSKTSTAIEAKYVFPTQKMFFKKL